MNKGTMLILGIVSILAMTVQSGLDFIAGGKEGYSSGPAGIPQKGRPLINPFSNS